MISFDFPGLMSHSAIMHIAYSYIGKSIINNVREAGKVAER